MGIEGSNPSVSANVQFMFLTTAVLCDGAFRVCACPAAFMHIGNLQLKQCLDAMLRPHNACGSASVVVLLPLNRAALINPLKGELSGERYDTCWTALPTGRQFCVHLQNTGRLPRR
jgi:hypothetical protein